jgi:hypothetical protein
MRGSERKGRKRKQLELWKWGIAIQGELLLYKVRWLVKLRIYLLKHKPDTLLNLRSIATRINTHTVCFLLFINFVTYNYDPNL